MIDISCLRSLRLISFENLDHENQREHRLPGISFAPRTVAIVTDHLRRLLLEHKRATTYDVDNSPQSPSYMEIVLIQWGQVIPWCWSQLEGHNGDLLLEMVLLDTILIPD